MTLSLDDRVVDMVEGGFDVSVRVRAAMPDSALVARKIGTLPDFVSNGPEAQGDLVRVLADWELPAPEIFAVTASRLGLGELLFQAR